MNLFYWNLILNLIDALISSIFIGIYFKQKKKFIITLFSVTFASLSYALYIGNSGITLSILVILNTLLLIQLFNKRLTFDHVYVTLFYHILILLSATSILIIQPFLSFTPLLSTLSSNTLFLVSCFISRLFLCLITYYLLKQEIDFSTNLDTKHWLFILVNELLLLSAMLIVTNSLIINNIDNTLIIVLLLIIGSAILFIISVYKINRLNEEKIKISKKEQEQIFSIQKYNAISNIKNEIDEINHQMFYILYYTQLLIKQEKYDEAQTLIENFKKKSVKFKQIIDTKNIVFDCLYSLKINDLICQNISINNCIFISKNDFFDDLSFINFLNEIIECFSSLNAISIKILEKNKQVFIYIMVEGEFIFNEDKFSKTINEITEFHETNYTILNPDFSSISFIIQQEVST